MGSACSKKRSDVAPYQEAGRIFAGFTEEFNDMNYFKELQIDRNRTVLVAKVDGEYVCTGSRCPHMGAPLAKGIYRVGRIKCPWHGAVFDLLTGDIEDFPGFDCLPMYHVTLRGDCVFVHVDLDKMPDRFLKPMVKMKDKWTKVVILGSGAAGYTCAQTLRQEGFDGRIIMLTSDRYYPYDRTKLTKAPLGGNYNDYKIRPASFYVDYDIEILINTIVDDIDMYEHKIYYEGAKSQLEFDKLFLAVGMRPRFYSGVVYGTELKNILTMSNIEDGQQLAKLAKGQPVVIIGSGFIAMELAESLSRVASQICILCRTKAPYGMVLGETTGKVLLQHFLENVSNVTFYCTDDVYSFQGNSDQEVVRVVTMKKRRLPCKVVVVAIGGVPNTELFKSSPLKLHPIDRSILVNKYMETSMKHVFAGGDCANFPMVCGARDRAVVGHWHSACTHGKVAALNMLGKNISVMDHIPFYWTTVFGLSVRYVGYGESYDEALIFGDISKNCFCTVYRRRKRFSAICCVGCDPLASEVSVCLELKKDWVNVVPDPIRERFPGDPLRAEVFGGYSVKDEIHTREHDLRQYKFLPPPLSVNKMIRKNREDVEERIEMKDDVRLYNPEEPTFALQMFTMQREEREAYLYEHGQKSGYEKLDKVYLNKTEDINLLDNPDERIPLMVPDKARRYESRPMRFEEERFDYRKPYSLRYMETAKRPSRASVLKHARGKVPQVLLVPPSESKRLRNTDDWRSPSQPRPVQPAGRKKSGEGKGWVRPEEPIPTINMPRPGPSVPPVGKPVSHVVQSPIHPGPRSLARELKGAGGQGPEPEPAAPVERERAKSLLLTMDSPRMKMNKSKTGKK